MPVNFRSGRVTTAVLSPFPQPCFQFGNEPVRCEMRGREGGGEGKRKNMVRILTSCVLVPCCLIVVVYLKQPLKKIKNKWFFLSFFLSSSPSSS